MSRTAKTAARRLAAYDRKMHHLLVLGGMSSTRRSYNKQIKAMRRCGHLSPGGLKTIARLFSDAR